jgi:hypothetical protein
MLLPIYSEGQGFPMTAALEQNLIIFEMQIQGKNDGYGLPGNQPACAHFFQIS